MSVIVIRDRDKEWRDVSKEWREVKPGDTRVTYKMLLPHSADLPNIQRSRYDPHHFEPPHSHPEVEVIYLLSGSLALGDQTLGFGDAIFVPKNTRYSLRAGDSGAEFVRVGLPVVPRSDT